MAQHTRQLIVITLVTLGLWGCAAADTSNPPSTSNEGSIELSLSETCDERSDPQCIHVGNQYVLQPSGFERAAVENAVAHNEEQQNTVDITFTDRGAKLFNELTAQASDADTESRLLLKVGDKILAAVSVHAPLSGDQVTLALSPEDDAYAIIEQIQGS